VLGSLASNQITAGDIVKENKKNLRNFLVFWAAIAKDSIPERKVGFIQVGSAYKSSKGTEKNTEQRILLHKIYSHNNILYPD
jgi:hypothetical protein